MKFNLFLTLTRALKKKRKASVPGNGARRASITLNDGLLSEATPYGRGSCLYMVSSFSGPDFVGKLT